MVEAIKLGELCELLGYFWDDSPAEAVAGFNPQITMVLVSNGDFSLDMKLL